jgi:hypothetical protein
MTKITYRVLHHENQRSCDVEMTEPGAMPRIVNTFNTEPDAWDWISEQEYVANFARRPLRPQKHPQK